MRADDHRISMEVQDEGGGGFLRANAYFNPAIDVSDVDFVANGKTCVGDIRDDLEEPLASKSPSKLSKIVRKRFPIVNWLPRYTTEDAIGDLVAGVTVGLTVIPQSLAYATIAHVPLQYGLYSSFLGCLIYIFIGGCKDVPFGPSAIASLMTYEAIGEHGKEHAIFLCFFSGVVQVLMGVFGLGFIIDFVSGPVASGFTSAVALIILTSQVKDLLGIRATGTIFIHTWRSIFENIHETKLWDAVLGAICIITLLILRLGSKIPISSSSADGLKRTKFAVWRNRFLWFVATSRNAILVVTCALAGYHFHLTGRVPFTLIGYVPEGLPEIQLPPLSYQTQLGNETTTVGLSEMVTNLGSGLIVVPLLGLLEGIAISRAFGHGKPVDSTQEFLALGLCNVANSFVQAFPGTGSISRSAVQHFSGSRTPLCSLYAGLLVIIALIYFTPCFYFIPKATLASVLIAAVIFMVEVKVVKPMWRSKRSDLILAIGTFVACLVFPLQVGVGLGVLVNIIFILRQAARPKVAVEKLKCASGIEYLMITPDRCLIFPSVDYVRNLVTKHSTRTQLPVVLDCSHIYSADFTAARVIQSLTKDFRSRNQKFVFYNLKLSVCSVFESLTGDDFVVVFDRTGLEEVLRN